MSTAKVATAARRVATAMTLTPKRVGPAAGAMSLVSPLNLEVDHLGHDEHAEAHPDEPAEPGDDQALVDEELAHISRVDEPDEREDDEGQGADDPGRGLGFRRHRLDLQLHLGALPEHVGEIR